MGFPRTRVVAQDATVHEASLNRKSNKMATEIQMMSLSLALIRRQISPSRVYSIVDKLIIARSWTAVLL